MMDNITKKTAQIGEYDSSLGGKENKMRLCREGFFDVGITALQSCMQSEDEWVTVDEIGYLDTECPEYCSMLLQLMQKKRVAAVVRKQDIPFLNTLCSRDDIFLIDLDDPFGNLGCVIMASGKAKRFGSNKLMADFKGKPLIEQALLATDNVFSRRVVVTRSKEVADYCKQRGIGVVLHELPNRNDTVRLGLLAMEETAGCLFCPGDQPLLKRRTVAALALGAKNEKMGIFRPVCQDTEGAPVLFPKDLFRELMTLPEGKGGGIVVKNHPEILFKLNIENPYELMDVDTPEQLSFLLSISDN